MLAANTQECAEGTGDASSLNGIIDDPLDGLPQLALYLRWWIALQDPGFLLHDPG